MDRRQAKEHVRGRMEDYLRDRGIDTRKPFRCLNPAHEDRHPSMRYDPGRQKCHCFSCGVDYDTFDLIGLEHALSGHALFLKAYELFGLSVEEDGGAKRNTQADIHNTHDTISNQHTSMRNTDTSLQITHTALHNDNSSSHNNDNTTQNTQSPPRADHTAYFAQCRARIADTDYLARRGLTQPTAERFGLGFDGRYTRGTGGQAWQALIIPTSDATFVARNTDPDAGKQARYRKQGGSLCFNLGALAEARTPIFITEGELDALSVAEAGGEAVALGSTSNVKRLVAHLESNKPAQPLILALDNDAEGERASGELEEALRRLKLPYYRMNIAEGYKDANEALVADREAFAAVIRSAERMEEELQEAERERYLQTSAACQLHSFMSDIDRSARAACMPTGFSALDAILDGGLYAGLYIVGAISSLGKTTFCLQIADQIAKDGHDVLIFSLEMARNELIAKSISRHTMEQDLLRSGGTACAKTTRGILAGARYGGYSEAEHIVIADALRAYAAYAEHIYIHVGIGDIGVDQLRETVDRHIRITGNAPVVLIDYVQILAPYNDRATDKQNTDKAVLELKRISRDFDIPVVGISSFNRDNYTAPVNLSSFKESGSLEYTSDVLLGLQYEGMDYRDGEKEQDRAKRVRTLMKAAVDDSKQGKPLRVQVKVLKNR
ncbi:toprim domain-containing protein, partial [Eubacteriales bacterium OttesenSCG-928-A19]|nr:toprim domain-containing protein [Eubacteriales bacterium OttesenSCG-928-A19]